jgi:hypothetical protein
MNARGSSCALGTKSLFCPKSMGDEGPSPRATRSEMTVSLRFWSQDAIDYCCTHRFELESCPNQALIVMVRISGIAKLRYLSVVCRSLVDPAPGLRKVNSASHKSEYSNVLCTWALVRYLNILCVRSITWVTWTLSHAPVKRRLSFILAHR